MTVDGRRRAVHRRPPRGPRGPARGDPRDRPGRPTDGRDVHPRTRSRSGSSSGSCSAAGSGRSPTCGSAGRGWRSPGFVVQVAIFSEPVGVVRRRRRARRSTSPRTGGPRGRAAQPRAPRDRDHRRRRRLQPGGDRRERRLHAGRPGALATAGVEVDRGPTNSVVVADPALRPLTDIFAIPAAVPLANVFSVGDVLIGIGVAATIAAGDAARPSTGRPRHARPARTQSAGGSSRTCVRRNARVRSNASRRFSRRSQPWPSSSYQWTS